MAAARNLTVLGQEDNRTTRSSLYVYGNAVPAPEEPERREEEPRRRIKKRVSPQVRRNRRKALYMSPGYVLFLAVAATVALIICVNYVQLQSQITSSARDVTVLQEELTDLRESNNTRYHAVTDSLNIEEIRSKAEDLGMIYAEKNQIIEYNSPSSDYVEQYETIPEDGVIAQSDGR